MLSTCCDGPVSKITGPSTMAPGRIAPPATRRRRAPSPPRQREPPLQNQHLPGGQKGEVGDVVAARARDLEQAGARPCQDEPERGALIPCPRLFGDRDQSPREGRPGRRDPDGFQPAIARQIPEPRSESGRTGPAPSRRSGPNRTASPHGCARCSHRQPHPQGSAPPCRNSGCAGAAFHPGRGSAPC